MPKTVDLRTEIPGPKSRAIIARKERVVADAKTLLAPFVIDHGHGCVVTDVDGNTLPRLVGRHRLPERRPHQRRGLRRPCTTRSTASCTPTSRSCRTSPTSSSPSGWSRAAPISGAEQGRVLQLGRRGGRERRQDRPARHRPAGRDRLRGRVPRPHADGDVADVQAASVQGRHGPVRPRGVPGAVPEPVPLGGRRPGRRGARRAAADARHARRRRGRRRDRLRAGPGRGRVRRAAGRVGARPARAGRRARHRPDRRRGAVRLRPHRQAVRDRALRRRARPDHDRQVDGGGRADLGRLRPRAS